MESNKAKNVDVKSKDVHIGLRIDRKMKEVLEKSDIDNAGSTLSLSEKIRKAVAFWVRYSSTKSKVINSDYVVFSINVLKIAFDSINDEELYQMSLQGYTNAMGIRHYLDDHPELKNLDEIRSKPSEQALDRMEYLVSNVYGSEGLGWFDEISVKEIENKIQINGNHRLGENFTRYFKFHVNINLKDFGYEISEERSTKIIRKNHESFSVEFICEKIQS